MHQDIAGQEERVRRQAIQTRDREVGRFRHMRVKISPLGFACFLNRNEVISLKQGI